MIAHANKNPIPLTNTNIKGITLRHTVWTQNPKLRKPLLSYTYVSLTPASLRASIGKRIVGTFPIGRSFFGKAPYVTFLILVPSPAAKITPFIENTS